MSLFCLGPQLVRVVDEKDESGQRCGHAWRGPSLPELQWPRRLIGECQPSACSYHWHSAASSSVSREALHSDDSKNQELLDRHHWTDRPRCHLSILTTRRPRPVYSLVGSRGPGQSVLGAGSHGHGSSPISPSVSPETEAGRRRRPTYYVRAPSAFRSASSAPITSVAGHVSSAELARRVGSIPSFAQIRKLWFPRSASSIVHTAGIFLAHAQRTTRFLVVPGLGVWRGQASC